MYHCHIRFCLLGEPCTAFKIFQDAPPLPNFTHEFYPASAPQDAAGASVVFARLPDSPTAFAAGLLQALDPGASLILLAGPGQVEGLAGLLEHAADIWPAELSETEARFQFTRWQTRLRLEKDHWEISQYLDAAINSVPNMVWYKTRDGIHEKVNDSFCRTVNKTKEQVQGQRHAYIWDVEQDDPACIESERLVMESRRTQVSEETVLTGEGLRLLTTYKTPLYDLDGSVMGTVGVGIDVTQERAYEQELIEKSRMMETIFTSMDCGVMCHSLDGRRVLSINRAALNILGYASEQDLLADNFDTVAGTVAIEDKEPLRSAIQSLKKPDDSVSVEYRVLHKDGERLHVMGNVKLIEENGELFYQRFLLDCTAQKLQEEREREQSRRRQMELVHALSIDYSLVCVFDLDKDQGSALRISDCPLGVLDNLFSGQQFNMAESLGKYIDTCVYIEDRETLRQACAPAQLMAKLTEQNRFYMNYRTICEGEMRYFQLKAVRTGSWSEKHTVVLGFRSVDEETRSEMEKKTLLEDALSQANRASKAKSVFLSNMSHDIRTPMNAIVGFTSLALNHLERREQVEEYLKKIMTSGNHLLSLINDILDMSRIESGKIHLDEELCSLPDILHSLHSIVQADIRAKQLEFSVDTVDITDEDIYCDKLRLNQVLLNLLSNSVKYTGAGGSVSMRITQKAGAPKGSAYYEFRIKDTGIGMSPEFVSHIFEPFERERNSTMSGVQGTGLGMAITKNIVDMMHGLIEVRSQPGVGTEFIVSFSFRLSPGCKEPQVIPELKNCRALVVDDDFNICDSVTYMLQQIGLRAEWTLSGKEAVLRTRQAVSRGDNYAVYIVDWLMPDMNGVEVARRIRQETGGDAPVVILTAYDWSDIEEEAREAGVAAFCRKPLFASELRNCLRSVVSTEGRSPIADEALPAPVPLLRHSGHILLAEDNELNQEIAVAILEEAGFTTDIASNGRLAVEMLKASAPGYYSLILMDVQMPVMGGYEATRHIRALENRQLAQIPIFAMTANAFDEDKQEAVKCGMNGHIAKPINIAQLLETLDQALAGK
ncbi:hybrid sensor histidine kinase/response regulator [Acutalibacter caecimuris]|uniref:hybrid sensor histidine kinase/response regulator n=1 Tax=Acutalibacter caecimuris TaxID=3093657 RepID=UPI002AC8F4CE|nr:response regulator [Acutalibacter sp. M00118]